MSEPGASKSSLKVEAAEAKRRAERREEERRANRLAKAEAKRRRAEKLRQRLTREVLFAGEGVSEQLTHNTSDTEALEARGLPVWHDAADLARGLGLELKTLRWLTFHREVAAVSHYRRFEIPKADGSSRPISSPRPKLRHAQQAVRDTILRWLPVTPQAHAFVPRRSTVSNAAPHVGQAALVKIDIVDFFGTITFPRVRGFFRALGYSGMVSTLLALLTTEAPRAEVEIDGRNHYVALGPRSLPQGALTSPELTNQIARGIDRRFTGYAEASGWTFTRYADDLTFSCGPEDSEDAMGDKVRRLIGTARAILEDEGFALNRNKLKVARAGRQQRVTGVVVNERPGIDRRTLRRFRAAVHRVGREGFRDHAERLQMLGYASYVHMVKPELGARWVQALKAAPTPPPTPPADPQRGEG